MIYQRKLTYSKAEQVLQTKKRIYLSIQWRKTKQKKTLFTILPFTLLTSMSVYTLINTHTQTINILKRHDEKYTYA